MKIKSLLLALLIGGAAPLSTLADNWTKKKAPIMTTWGEKLDPSKAWQEYPRPQLVRSAWMNLNGEWGFFIRKNKVDLSYEPNAGAFAKTILVPYPVESALSGIMDTDFETNARSTMMYRRTFTMPASYRDRHVLIHFGAVDWQCKIFINGKEAGTHRGGNDPFSIDITPFLAPTAEQEVVVAVYDPTNLGGQPNGKQSVKPEGIWYSASSGIWQTVWLEPVNEAHITRYEVVPDIDNSQIALKVLADDASTRANIVVKYDGRTVAHADNVAVNAACTIAIPDEKLWTPATPNLYDLEIELLKDGSKVDEAKGYFGMRKFSRAKVNGRPALLLNNSPIFLMGPLDQGWWPDGLLTPPSYEAMVFDLQAIKALGMNMVRKHIKVEPDLWYEWCDRNGLVVWQDMVSGGTGGSMGDAQAIQENFYRESIDVVNALKQHPSIGAWIPFNEGWGQFDGLHTVRGVNAVRQADDDPYRLINSVTGWTDYGVGDFYDAHSYPAPDTFVDQDNIRISSCGEYGGITMLVPGHQWSGSQQVYTAVPDGAALTDLFCQYVTKLQQLQATKGLWAAVYTQITDVEQELNGLYSYDRKVKKFSDAQGARIKERIEQLVEQHMTGIKTIVPAADENGNALWDYTVDRPGEGWQAKAFDSSTWQEGAAGFGDRSAHHTDWEGDQIWIRRHFALNGIDATADLSALKLWMFHDDEAEVYINGVLACAPTGWNDEYQLFDISKEALAAIDRSGDNVIAIHCTQHTGGKYIDAGFKMLSLTPNTAFTISAAQAKDEFVMPTSELKRQEWKYTFDELDRIEGSAWRYPQWNESEMTTGLGGFGGFLNNPEGGTPKGSVIGTRWDTGDIYLRKALDLTGKTREEIKNFVGRIYHDEDVEVYFNGILAFSSSDGSFLTSYKDVTLSRTALNSLTPDDKNVVAIHCRNKVDGAYIDFGILQRRTLALTGIEEVQPAMCATPQGVYNLSGQLVSHSSHTTSSLPKGIYIANGRKFVVK